MSLGVLPSVLLKPSIISSYDKIYNRMQHCSISNADFKFISQDNQSLGRFRLLFQLPQIEGAIFALDKYHQATPLSSVTHMSYVVFRETYCSISFSTWLTCQSMFLQAVMKDSSCFRRLRTLLWTAFATSCLASGVMATSMGFLLIIQ